MRFNKHSSLEGKHAFLSPSQYHWVNYTDEKLIARYSTHQMAERGTRLHELAKQCIELGVKLPRNNNTLNMYVNDAIGFHLTPEQPLYFSENCFGTADAIGFSRNTLRIHDLKTGVTKASMTQLEVYAALFCLEYDVNPADIDMELRIYQSDEVIVHNPEVDDIFPIMDKIVYFDHYINELREEMS